MTDNEAATYQRPANLTYAVDEPPPSGKLLLLGLQYAVLDASYLVLVAIIVRHSNRPRLRSRIGADGHHLRRTRDRH